MENILDPNEPIIANNDKTKEPIVQGLGWYVHELNVKRIHVLRIQVWFPRLGKIQISFIGK